MKRRTLWIETRDAPDDNSCSPWCPFFAESRYDCTLFNVDLEDVELPDGHVWQDDMTPWKERCWKCQCMD